MKEHLFNELYIATYIGALSGVRLQFNSGKPFVDYYYNKNASRVEIYHRFKTRFLIS